MIRVKQCVKSEWLSNRLTDMKCGNVFPSFSILEVMEFNDSAASLFDQGMWDAINDGQTIIPVIVDSFGGEVYSLMRMLDTIKSAQAMGITVMTLGKSKCMSCGSVLVASGSKGHRYMQPQSTMMIHEVSSSGRGKNMELQADAEETDRLNKLLLEKLSEFAEKPKNFFSKLIHRAGHADMFINAKDVVVIGLVDHIGEPSFEMAITLDVKIVKNKLDKAKDKSIIKPKNTTKQTEIHHEDDNI